MKTKHLQVRIEQCLALAKLSNCPRRKFGALLLDPIRNVTLIDAYNGGPRGAKGELCGGHFCERDGLKREQFTFEKKDCPRWEASPASSNFSGRFRTNHFVDIRLNGVSIHQIPFDPAIESIRESLLKASLLKEVVPPEVEAEAWIQGMLDKYPGVKSGTHMEAGCHHAEMNIVCNAAASGVSTKGAWLLITGEPCQLCAKLIHHAGIVKVVVIRGGYAGENGLAYLMANGVEVQEVEGPQDPRLSA